MVVGATGLLQTKPRLGQGWGLQGAIECTQSVLLRMGGGKEVEKRDRM